MLLNRFEIWLPKAKRLVENKLFGTKISVITSTSQKSHCTLDNAGLYRMTPDQNEKENEEPMVAIEEKDLILVSAQKEERGCQP